MARIIQYKFDIRELLEEVTGRTSIIARAQVAAEKIIGQEAIERQDSLTLTEGEWVVFRGLLHKAASDLFEWTAPFSRNLPKGYECDDTPYGQVEFLQQILYWFDDNKIPTVKTNLKEALVNHIISRWFVTVLPDHAPQYWAYYEEAAEQVKIGMDSERKVMQRSTYWLH